MRIGQSTAGRAPLGRAARNRAAATADGRATGLRHARRLLPLLGYAGLALLSFPTLETLGWGEDALNRAHDVFDANGGVPRIGATLSGIEAFGLTNWDPRMMTGLPVLGTGSLTPLAPDVFIALGIGPFGGYAVTAWLLSATAGLGMHRFLRDSVGLAVPAAVVGAVFYMFSFWHYVYGFAAVLIPVVLWAGDRLAGPQPGRARGLVIGVASVTLGLWAGLSQITFMVAGVQLAWVALGSSKGSLMARLRAWLSIWAIGGALFLPVLLEQASLLPVSNRQIWNLDYLYESRPLVVIDQTIRRYASMVLPVPTAGFGRPPEFYGTWFLGAIGLFLASVMLMFGGRRRARRFGLLLLILIPVVDAVGQVMTPRLDGIGALSTFQFIRVRHILPFALAVVVALGADRLLGMLRLPRRDQRTTVLLVGLAGLVSVLVAIELIWLLSRGAPSAQQGFQVVATAAVTGSLFVGLAALMAVLGFIGSARCWTRRRAAWLAIGVLLLVAGERALYAHGERLVDGKLGTWQASMAISEAQQWLIDSRDRANGRTLTLGDEPNRMSFHGLQQVDGYVAVYPLGYHRLFDILIERCLEDDAGLAAYYRGWGQRVYAFCDDLHSGVLDLLGVRWIVERGRAFDDPTFVERARWGDLRVLENLDPLPRAFIVGTVYRASSIAEAVEFLRRADRTVLATVAVLTDGGAPSSMPTSPPSPGTATIVRDSGRSLEVSVQVADTSLLVVTDAVHPSWIAKVDGAPSTILTVDLAFRGVIVPPGTHRVVFEYEPQWGIIGAVGVVAAVATLATMTWILMARTRQPDSNRRADPDPSRRAG